MRRYLWLWCGLMIMLAVAPLAAQTDPPVYVVVEGALMRATAGGTLEPVAACALPREPSFSAPVPSPDGQLLALKFEPLLVTEARERVGGWGGGENPADLIICNPDSGIIARFSQPEDAALFDPSGRPDKFTIRSLPAWSPDGSALSWTECPAACEPAKVVRYDLASGALTELATLPPLYGVPTSVPVAWGGPLILVQAYTYDEAAQREVSRLFGYDPATGGLVLDVELSQTDTTGVTDFFWIDAGGTPQIAVLRSSGAWVRVDPATGETDLLEGTPEVFNPLAPEGISAVADGRAAQFANLHWLVREGETLTPLSADVRGFTPPSVAADGNALLFYDNLTPRIYRAGEIVDLPLPPLSPATPAYASWGPQAWRLYAGELPSSGEYVCLGAPEPRLTVGAAARVVVGQGANNLRDAASTGGSLLGTIPEGAMVDVLGGPECANGYTWWQVVYNGMTGWTAEGEGLDYWLEPAGG